MGIRWVRLTDDSLDVAEIREALDRIALAGSVSADAEARAGGMRDRLRRHLERIEQTQREETEQ